MDVYFDLEEKEEENITQLFCKLPLEDKLGFEIPWLHQFVSSTVIVYMISHDL